MQGFVLGTGVQKWKKLKHVYFHVVYILLWRDVQKTIKMPNLYSKLKVIRTMENMKQVSGGRSEEERVAILRI